MSRKLKALAALNILGWIVAVPLLLFAVVDPFVDFPALPTSLGGGNGGTVQLEPPSQSTSPSRAARRKADPVRAARDALSLLTSQAATPVTVAPNLGGAPRSSDDRAGTVGQLRSRVGTPQSNGSPPATGSPVPPAPASPPQTTPPATPPESAPPSTTPVPNPPDDGVAARTPPAPERPQEPESRSGGPAGEDTPPPPEFPAPVPETPETPETPAPPTEEPPPPEIPAPPGDEETPGPEGPDTPAPPEEPAPPAPEAPAPAAPAAPEDPPEDPDDQRQNPAGLKPPHEGMPQADAPGAPGPGPGDC